MKQGYAHTTSFHPFEINRQVTGRICDLHFAPTEASKKNLLAENISENNILVTGNTVIDALFESVKRIKNLSTENIENIKKCLFPDQEVILVTGHRRENHGEGFERICQALKEIAKLKPEVKIIYPVHLNPMVQEPVNRHLKDSKNILLISPLSYPEFIWLMNRSKIIITDSGGVQEEAPSLGKPVLVMRDNTERPEAVEAGTVILVGTNKERIVNEALDLLENKERFQLMSELHNPYGDGKACSRIIDFFKNLNSMIDVVTIGLGYIGLPTSVLMASKGKKVLGVDIDQDVVNTINKGNIHIVEPELDVAVKKVVDQGNLIASTKAEEAQAYLVVVPTPFKGDHEPDISYVEIATQGIISLLKEGDLYILESTSPVGTTEKMQEMIFAQRPELKNKIYMAYCPERVLPGNVMPELVHNDRVIGGVNKASTQKAILFYSSFVEGTLHPTDAKRKTNLSKRNKRCTNSFCK